MRDSNLIYLLQRAGASLRGGQRLFLSFPHRIDTEVCVTVSELFFGDQDTGVWMAFEKGGRKVALASSIHEGCGRSAKGRGSGDNGMESLAPLLVKSLQVLAALPFHSLAQMKVGHLHCVFRSLVPDGPTGLHHISIHGTRAQNFRHSKECTTKS